MNRATYGLAAVVLAAGGVANAEKLPGTMNFEDQTGGRIVATVAEGTSNEKEVEVGDFDGDHDLDVVIAVAAGDFGQRKNKLYRNDAGVFNEISTSVPLFTTNFGDVARTAFFRDYTMDGWLDLIIVCDNNTAGDPGRTKLWVNQHTGGVHTGWIEDGLARLGPNTGGAACSAVSIDNDQVTGFDLYVGNYPGPSQDTIYVNDGTGVFTPSTIIYVPPDFDYTVDVAAGDLNGDGKTDLLISNDFDPNYVYYNDNLGQGSGVGDYRYGSGGTGGRQSLGTASGGENAMEAGDFDGDNDLDVYWNNRTNSTQDIILVNQGTLPSGMVDWNNFTDLPDSVTSFISRKATVADLNADGRVDILVMKQDFGNSRPTILRNTSVNGQISFVDWTPALPFPDGNTHRGWHAAVFDATADGDVDIFLGAFVNDHFFEQVPSNEVDENLLFGGTLPALWNLSPVAVLGHASSGESDTYRLLGIVSDSFISVVVNGPDDYEVQVTDGSGAVLASSNRGGLGIEEALQIDVGPGNYGVTVIVIDSVGIPTDINDDGTVDVLDLIDLLLCFGQPSVPGCEAQDINGDTTVDVLDLIELLLDFGTSVTSDYVLEVLARG